MKRKSTVLAVVLSLPILLSVLVAIGVTARWPLVGDTALMHYAVFMLEKGKAPYTQIFDINMPGTYLFEYLGMRLFGMGALAWRMWDLALCVALSGAMAWLAGARRRWAGLLAGGIFYLLHVRDGMAEGGQRDLTATVLLAFACACASSALSAGGQIAAGLLLGLAILVKPPLAIAGVGLLGAIFLRKGASAGARLRAAAALGGGVAVPLLLCLAMLTRWGAVGGFVRTLTLIVPYHATLGRRPLGYFPGHLLPSTLLPLAGLLAIVLLLAWRGTPATARDSDLIRRSLPIGAMLVAGLLSFAGQGKALPYHRYPANAFFLLLAALWFHWALEQEGAVRIAGLAGWLVASLWLAPVSALRTTQYHDSKTSEIAWMQRDLQERGGAALDGEVQCIDYTSGCLNALYDTRIEQATGTFYDCYLFGPASSPAVQVYRRQFLTAYQSHRPRVLT